MGSGASDQITFVIFAYNEIERIQIVIRNFKPFGRILVVDNYSTDGTAESAEAQGCEVLRHKNPGWMEDEDTAAKVLAAVRTEWIYWGYTDEMLEYDAIQAMFREIESGKYDIINLLRKNYYYGEFMHTVHLARTNRVFKKGAIDFTGNKIHSFGRPTVPELNIKKLDDRYFVHHFISNTAKSYVGVLDRYTDIERYEPGQKSYFRIFLSAVRMFTYDYFFRDGRRAGLPAAYLNLLMVFYSLLSRMKKYEESVGLDRGRIEQKNNVFRGRIQADIDARLKPADRS